ncbi:MAG TPA: non-homologous end-joining DNA ligase [Actinocrinis sp.]|nr:non-homologous end-joining DNA ligase [Actinocrinis sp.]
MTERAQTTVDGHPMVLTHLQKPMWPATGWTKGEALHYYAQVGPALLPHVRGRAATFVRFPEGVGGPTFYAKHPPAGTPEWVSTVQVPSREGPTKPYVALDSMAELMYMANHYALEIHVPQWVSPEPDLHDRLVIDLDPGPGRAIGDCAHLALLARDLLAADGLTAWAKTSGSKGLHLYVPLVPSPAADVVAYVKDLAERLHAAVPDLAIHKMTKSLREGRVFVDWSQNSTAKTTAAPYTLRAGPHPTVSAPVSWAEVEQAARRRGAKARAAAAAKVLEFTADDVLTRLAQDGDLFADLLDESAACRLP